MSRTDWPLTCPRCGSSARQRQEYRPEANPLTYYHRCYDCGWHQKWRIDYAELTHEDCLDTEDEPMLPPHVPGVPV